MDDYFAGTIVFFIFPDWSSGKIGSMSVKINFTPHLMSEGWRLEPKKT